MLRVRDGLAAGWISLVGVLVVLVQLGLGGLPALAGAISGVAVCAAVARGATQLGAADLGPADLVTLGRAMSACALLGLALDPVPDQPLSLVVVPLAALALLLDAVDGRVARSTGTASAFGGRFDGEADAFLLLVLSAHVAPTYGWWVLAIGLARYVFGLAGWWWSWMRAELPFRYWRKVVTAVQGIALLVAMADLLPRELVYTVLGGALALLAESFGRDALWLWQRRPRGTKGSETAVEVGLQVP